MGHLLLILLGALVVGAIAYGVTWIVTGRDRGLDPEEPDGRAVPLPASRPLTESDIETVRFDTALRGYRMDQVDAALRRAAYDLGYKEELIEVLEAEIAAIRAGRTDEAEELRSAREGSQATGRPSVTTTPSAAAASVAQPGAASAAPSWANVAPDDDEPADGNGIEADGSDEPAARATSGR